MKKSDTSELRKIPNIGPSIAEDLLRLGIHRLEDLAGRDPVKLYETLCRKDGIRYDICVLDVFTASVAIANGEPPQPWWVFSRKRKAEEKQKISSRSSAHT